MIRTFWLALRNLSRHRRRALLTAAAIFLGVFAVTSLRGILNGVQQSLADEVILGNLGALQIHRAGYLAQVVGTPLNLDLPTDDAFLARLEAVPNVKAVAPRIMFGGMVNEGDDTRFSMLTGIDAVREAAACPKRTARIEGAGLPSGPHDAILSVELAKRLGLKPGAKPALMSPDRDGSLNATELHFTGTMGAAGAVGFDSKAGLVPLSLAQELLRMPGRATEITVGVVDRSQVAATAEALRAVLGPEYEVHPWYEIAPTVFEAVQLQDKALGVVSAVLLLVALLGVVNTMLMSVLERTREIGTMLALGMRRTKILVLFLAEALFLATFAALPATGLSMLLMRSLAQKGMRFQAPGGGFLDLYPVLLPKDVVVVLVLATVGALGAAAWPAWKASRLRPVEALSAL